ncbi:MAG: MATE family efflux transporter [Clostridium sp.]|nr:MATE family efflux transporter [Clostridium sp.]
MKRNMTEGSEWKTIFSFSLPIMGANLLQVTYNFADSVILGNFVGSSALGAVGLVFSMVWLLTAVCSALGNGTNIAVAQFFGAGRKQEIHDTISTAYLLCILTGAGLLLLAFLIADPLIVGFLKAPENMQADSRTYFLIYGAGTIFLLLYNVTYGILRAHGDSRGAMIFLFVSAVLNVLLDLVCVVNLRMGVAGAAIATVVSEAGAAAASLIYMNRVLPGLLPRRIGGETFRRYASLLTKLSVPIALQTMVNSICFLILQRLINSFGTASIEGYAAMLKIEQYAHIPSNSFNVAISSFTGQNIGAGLYDRAKRGYRATVGMGVGICAVLCLVVFLNDTRLLSIFGITGESLRRACEHLDLLMFFIWMSTITNITNGFLQGAGDVRIPAISTFLNLAVRLSLSFLLALTPVGYRCYFVSMPPAWILACLLVVSRYRSGKWMRYSIVSGS